MNRLFTAAPRKARRRSSAIAATVAALASIAGCGSGDDADAGSDDECGQVEADSLDDLDGETVAETDIEYRDGEGALMLGALAVEMPILRELDYYFDSEGRNVTVPPTWLTLDKMQLHSDQDPFGNPTIGLAVFGQTTMTTDDACRREVLDAYWTVARFTEAEVIHESETTHSETDVTCWTEVRFGQVRSGFDPEHQSVTLFGGPGVASSAIIMWAPASYTDIPRVTGDLVESVCGTRPDGL